MAEQEPKGFFLFDTKEKSYEFIEIKSRPFLVRELAFENISPKEMKERCEQEIEEACSRQDNPIVRIRLVRNDRQAASGARTCRCRC